MQTEILKKKFKYYILLLSIGLAVYHTGIWVFQKSNLNIFSSIALIPIAALYFCTVKKYKKQLVKIPYLNLKLHYITYILVNGSFWIHALLAKLVRPNFALSSTWFGALLGMSLLWGTGLLVHTLVSIKRQGYDNVEF